MPFQIDTQYQLTNDSGPASQGDVLIQYDLDANATIHVEYQLSGALYNCTKLFGDFGVVASGNNKTVYWSNPEDDVGVYDGSIYVYVVKVV